MRKKLEILLIIILSAILMFLLPIFIYTFMQKPQSKFVIAGLEKVYNSKDKTIDDLCRDHYELSYSYYKDNNEYYKNITLNKMYSNFWTGIFINDINNKADKEERIYYKNGKYYESDTDKEREDLNKMMRPYFQNDIFSYDEFEVEDEVDDFGPPPVPALYAKYKDNKSFNDYFSKIGRVTNENEDITIYAKYQNDDKEPITSRGYFEIHLERKSEDLRERCLLKDY